MTYRIYISISVVFTSLFETVFQIGLTDIKAHTNIQIQSISSAANG